VPWLSPGDPFPPPDRALGEETGLPGLLAAGADLSTDTLLRAYTATIFPWFGQGQPILWWSLNPRMVLRPQAFKFSPSLRKTARAWLRQGQTELLFDRDFEQVVWQCAQTPRAGQTGTWITADMQRAYGRLHAQGLAHSAECWQNGQLVGGLYFVAAGRAVFGESMFAHVRDSSKMALSALVCTCLKHQVGMIDCQQETAHLASLGARPIDRLDLQKHVQKAQHLPQIDWAQTSITLADVLETWGFGQATSQESIAP
jgi:leucyl/phenylalanyl-tRNA---protein transferase